MTTNIVDIMYMYLPIEIHHTMVDATVQALALAVGTAYPAPPTVPPTDESTALPVANSGTPMEETGDSKSSGGSTISEPGASSASSASCNFRSARQCRDPTRPVSC